MRTNLLVRSLFALIVGTANCAAALAGAFDNEILAYEQQDALFPPPQGAIVVTGSSTIGRWNTIRNDLAPLEIIPRGFGGSTADDLDYYLERIVLAYAPRAVVIYEGDNDIAQGWTPQYVASRIAGIAGRISAQYPNARVYIISIKPSPSRWGVWPQMQQANQLLADFCATDPRYRYIDAASALLGSDGLPRPEYYASDTLHLSTAGYTAWTGAVRPVLIAGEQSSIVVPGLQGQDIGAVAAAGSSSVSGGAFTVRGSGSDVWDTADEFHYVWRSLNGDGQITARVASQTNTASWAKAGVMLREQLTANSRYAIMFVTPEAGSFLQYRTVTGGSAGPGSGTAPGIAAPYWVRLVRQGNVVTGYNSPDGVTWTLRGSVTFSTLPSTLYIGLAVSSHNDGVLGTAVFDNVLISGSSPPPPPPPPPPTDVTPPTVPTGLQATAVGTNQINLSWNASSDSGTGVAGYRVFRNGVPAGTSTTTTYADTALIANTLYTYTVSAYDAASPANESGQSGVASATTQANPASAYQSQDIGAVGVAGSSSESGGVFTVRGSGYDVAGTSDEFHYVWQSLTGDGQITVRVASQTKTANEAKAGVMLREQLTATSRHAFMFVTPASGSFLQYRTVTGGSTAPSLVRKPGIKAPYWLRLVRQGNVVTGYNSRDGITWAQRGSVTFSSLPSTVYIGLAVSSANDGVLGTAVCDNVARSP
ncbi:MAG: GDSL-type esterase/lipase family protein [Cryobacterium sp.]